MRHSAGFPSAIRASRYRASICWSSGASIGRGTVSSARQVPAALCAPLGAAVAKDEQGGGSVLRRPGEAQEDRLEVAVLRVARDEHPAPAGAARVRRHRRGLGAPAGREGLPGQFVDQRQQVGKRMAGGVRLLPADETQSGTIEEERAAGVVEADDGVR
jgi:hypothetical protein